jgi:diguanylate cyclase (GGDEF)-like protein
MRTEKNTQVALVSAKPTPPTRRLFRYATYGSPLPLLATEGPKHVVVYANPAFCRLSKRTQEELVGRPYAETMQEAERSRCSALLDRVYHTGQTEALADQEHAALIPPPVYWSYTAWAVLDEEEHPTGVMLQVSDTTEAVLFRQQIATVNAELLVSGLRQHEVTEATHRLNALLEAQATADGLTGLKNHRAFQERLADEVKRSLRYRSPLSVLLLDVDNFKQYNDDYGHLTGDAILRSIGGILSAIARHTDMVARYGGEEFAVILTETDATGAKVLAERFRIAVETAPWSKRPVTVSVGASTFSELTCDPISLIAGADRALYRSKHRGRNCVTSAMDAVAPLPVYTEMSKPLQPAMNETLDRHNETSHVPRL